MDKINHRTFRWQRLPAWLPVLLRRCNRKCSWDSHNSSFRLSPAFSSSVLCGCSCRRRGSDTTANKPHTSQSRRNGSQSRPTGSSNRKLQTGTGKGRRNIGTVRTSSRFLVKSRSKPSGFNYFYYNDNRFELLYFYNFNL